MEKRINVENEQFPPIRIILVAAMSINRVIGYQNKLPWCMPADLQYFKAVTIDKTVVMGRKTFESLGGKPLKKRRNIVVTHHPDTLTQDGYDVARSLTEAIQIAKQDSNLQEIMIIGGQSIYEQSLSIATDIYLTVIEEKFIGDAYFPDFSKQEWTEVFCEEHLADENNPYPYRFLKFKRMV
jgi:dihydrofolate reductase